MAVDPRLMDLLGRVFEDVKERTHDESFERNKRDFLFHMTDWQEDLEKLAELFRNPTSWEADSACDFVVGFLYHVVPHVNAAARLLVGCVGDPFSQEVQ